MNARHDVVNTKLLARRQIFLSGVSDDEADWTISNLEYLALMAKEPIHLIITSPGGNVYAGLAVFDTLRAASERGSHIIAEVRGYGASMGAVVLQAGDTRLIRRNGYLLLHEPSQFEFLSNVSASEASERAKELERINRHLAQLIANRSGQEVSKILRLWKKKDVWLDANQSKEMGLVDEIV